MNCEADVLQIGLLDYLPQDLKKAIECHLTHLDAVLSARFSLDEAYCLMDNRRDVSVAIFNGKGSCRIQRVDTKSYSGVDLRLRAGNMTRSYKGDPPEEKIVTLVLKLGGEFQFMLAIYIQAHQRHVSSCCITQYHPGGIVLLDHCSFFYLTGKRLEREGYAEYIELSRRMTEGYLMSVCDFCRGREALLELYLLSCVELHDTCIDNSETIARYLEDGPARLLEEKIVANCNRYLVELFTEISGMY